MDVHFLAIDGFNLVRRIFEARKVLVPGDMQGVVQATVSSVQRAISEHRPTHAALVFEPHDRTWRHLLYPGYKASRKPPPPILLDGIPVIEAAIREETGMSSCSVPNYEADDVIATIARVVADHGGRVVILSTDRIFLQLAGGGISIHDHFGDIHYRVDDVEEKLGVKISQVVDYFALVGDKSNDIDGVPGIGPKSAVQLLSRFADLDAILMADPAEGAAKQSENRLIGKVQAHDAEARRSHQLVQLKTDVELGRNLRSFRLPQKESQ